MKDIKQYFANGRNIVNKEATAIDPDNVSAEQEETIARSKRKRVKIRISLNDSASICDIIDSKSDLIDKTPSPFNGKVNNGRRIRQDKTPKSDLAKSDLKPQLEKVIDYNRMIIEIRL
jgi:hypothetical protein